MGGRFCSGRVGVGRRFCNFGVPFVKSRDTGGHSFQLDGCTTCARGRLVTWHSST